MAKAFDVRVEQRFEGGSMAVALDRLTDRMKRQALRRIMAASGSHLAKEIRSEIKERDMPYSRGRNAQERRKSREKGLKPLVRTIKVKAWARFEKGLVGSIVGPGHPEGGHGHLVERGHLLPSGGSTVAHRFQEAAERDIRRTLFQHQRNTLAAWMKKQRAKGKL